jgi:hypothetical protein
MKKYFFYILFVMAYLTASTIYVMTMIDYGKEAQTNDLLMAKEQKKYTSERRLARKNSTNTDNTTATPNTPPPNTSGSAVVAATSTPTSANTNDRFGIKMLYSSLSGGRAWTANWSDSRNRLIDSGDRDPYDNEFIVRGNGTATIDGQGVARINGESPRMYIYDINKLKKWNNVEVTVYGKRISELGTESYQGFVIGARSDHQDASLEKPCMGRTYYGRLLYDGRAVFQKEVIHEGAYSINMPSEANKANWNTSDGSMPRNIWIGLKFIVKTGLDGKSVKLELYRDMTDGLNGGTWEKLAEYTDSGNWFQTDTNVDIVSLCGYSAGEVLLVPGTSVFIRNDKINSAEYKRFSIREIQ